MSEKKLREVKIGTNQDKRRHDYIETLLSNTYKRPKTPTNSLEPPKNL